MTEPIFEINGRQIGKNHLPYVIAEISANHNGSLDRAKAIIRAAKDAGADAVKLQTYTADTMTIRHSGPDFQITGGLWNGYSLHQLYEEAHTPWEWHAELYAEGRREGITVFSTPFDSTALEFLESLNTPLYKVASPEIIDLPLLKLIANTGKPVIISTGMADLGEINDAVNIFRKAGNDNIALLHCVSGYPTPVKESNIRTIPHLADAFNVVSGLSDHTTDISVPIAAIALGACIIEKHFTLNRNEKSPDVEFSLEPDELESMCRSCNDVWHALGKVNYDCNISEEHTKLFRRSLYVVKDIKKGNKFTIENIRSIRPSYGLSPKYFPIVLSKYASIDIARGTPLSWDLII